MFNETLETTVVAFKPECRLEYIELAKKAFAEKKLKITRSRHVMITTDVVKQVFTRHNGPILEAVLEHLRGETLPILELKAPRATEAVRDIVGRFACPDLCDRRSLRFIFAMRDRFPRPKDIGRGYHPYVRNYIYRSHDMVEAARDAAVLFDDSLLWRPE